MVVTATEFKTNFGKYLDLLPSLEEFVLYLERRLSQECGRANET